MAGTDIGVGDSELATLLVAPADNTTQAALTVTAPDGTATPYAASGGTLDPIPNSSDTQQLWTTDQPVVYSAPGRWVLAWTVTGTGEGAEDLDIYVVASPVAGGPTWLPGRSRVANYLPHRTLAVSTGITGSADVYEMTFDSSTRPSGVQIDRLIADGAAWVQSRIAPMHASSQAAAGLLCALWAAVATERSWPKDDSSLERARDMEKSMNDMLAGLIASNTIANAGDGNPETVDVVLPVWSFPPADCRYDSARYW